MSQVKEKVKHNLKPFSIDQYGIKNYNSFYLLLMGLVVLYSAIAILSYALYQVELAAPHGNIKTYKDAFWTLQMSASTIGFGDFYPVTVMGRLIVSAMFYIGIGMVGFIGAQLVNKFTGFSDTNVKNREIRKLNHQIIEQNIALEKKLQKIVDHLGDKAP